MKLKPYTAYAIVLVDIAHYYYHTGSQVLHVALREDGLCLVNQLPLDHDEPLIEWTTVEDFTDKLARAVQQMDLNKLLMGHDLENKFEDKGYFRVDTGGDCDAYRRDLEHYYLLVTDDANVPKRLDAVATVGLYSIHTDEYIDQVTAKVEDLLQFKSINFPKYQTTYILPEI